MRLALLTLCVLIAFAGNSVLARLALNSGDIGPWGFSLLRFASGAIILLLLANGKSGWRAGRWPVAIALLAYGVFFSFAYLQLSTGTGALILFASVQITMLSFARFSGEKLGIWQWSGLGLAFIGLVYLFSPDLTAPHPLSALMMTASGVGWGVYSVSGKSDGDPLHRTAGNFARVALLLLALTPIILFALPEARPTSTGMLYAVLSGTVTSGLGYALWYRVLRHLTVTRAAISQLSVPIIAALGGVIFVTEPLTLSFILASSAVLLGVGLVTITRTN